MPTPNGSCDPGVSNAPCAPANPAVKIVTVCASGCTYSTIQSAVSAAQCGWTIQVQNGTYTSSSRIEMSKNCTAAAPITLMAYPGAHPIYKAGYSNFQEFHITGSWWIIDGFEVTGNYDGIKIDEGSHITLRNNWVHANQNQGILVGNEGSIGGDDLIYQNTIELNGQEGAGLTNPCNFNGGVSSTRHCLAIHLSSGGLNGVCSPPQWQIKNVTIKNNIIRMSGGGIQFNASNGKCDANDYAYLYNTRIENNIFEDNYSSIPFLLQCSKQYY